MAFRDRNEAGHLLAAHLGRYGGRPDAVVLGLPCGGVPVGFEIAHALSAPLDVFLVRQLGYPSEPELAIGVIVSGGVELLDEPIVHSFGLPQDVINVVVRRERAELERWEHAYRGKNRELDLMGKTVILVDDGLATGATLRAAVKAARAQGARHIVAAAPVAAAEACDLFRHDVDDTVCLQTPAFIGAIGAWYESFDPVSDEAVQDLLARAAAWRRATDEQR